MFRRLLVPRLTFPCGVDDGFLPVFLISTSSCFLCLNRFDARCLEIDASLDWNFIKEARDPLALALSREVNGFHGFIQSTSAD